MQKKPLFSRWTWISEKEFRETFGYVKNEIYPSHKVLSSIRYGCERVDVECGGTISSIIGEKEFPYGLTTQQTDVVLEAAAWTAHHWLINGGWDRGSDSISMGQTSASRTNPDDPDYFPPFLKDKLAQAGLLNLVIGKNLPSEEFTQDPAYTYRGEDSAFFNLSLDAAKRHYLAKKGSGSLTSKDESVKISPPGDPYEGVDLSTDTESLKKWKEETLETITETIGQALKGVKECFFNVFK